MCDVKAGARLVPTPTPWSQRGGKCPTSGLRDGTALLPLEGSDNMFPLFRTSPFMVFCYSSPRELIQTGGGGVT